MSVYLESVHIAGIMGIPNELQLDFTAPLTLIYAPNGTGKTSTWTAVKALMSTGIDTDIVCRAAESKPSSVMGRLRIGDVRCTATATTGGLTLESPGHGRVTGTTALRWLAPEVDTTGIQTKGGVLKDRLISQITGCRFLPAESLLYLIDNGEESTELRRKLFADLTGTSALQAEVRETTRYRNKLSQELDIVSRELQTIEEQMQAFVAVHNPDSSDSMHLIGEAASVAGIQVPSEASVQDTVSLLRQAETSKSASLETSRAAYTTWRSIDSTYPDLDSDVAAASAALKAATGAREAAQQALSRAQSELEPGRAARALQQYESFRKEFAKITALVATEGRTKGLMESPVGSLRDLLRPFESEYAIESRLEALQVLDRTRHAYRNQISERQELLERKKKLLEGLSNPSRDLQTRLDEKTVERSEVAARIRRQSDLATSLRASAQNLVADSRLSVCPCCSHRWQSVDALLAAIAEGDRGGQTDPRLQQELNAVEEAIRQLQVEYAAASAIEEQCRKLENKLREVNPLLERTEQLALTNGVPRTRLLEDTDTLQEVYTLRSSLNIWRILEALEKLAGDLNETQTVDAVLSGQSGRGEDLKITATHAEQTESERKLVLEREQATLLSSSQLVTRCEEQAVKLARIRHERDAAIEQLRAAGLFAGQQTAAALNEGMSIVERLRSLITQVSAAVEASAAIAARERIAANQKVLQSKQDRITREVALADQLIELLSQAEKRAGRQFFEKLGPAVGTLFDHMQVNRVFRNLEISAVKESFRLDGQLDDGVSLDPGSHFSQGQRQDLALSMFLVRAASLGGSFFLDEPLLHLDDLNRTALLDCLRACILGTASSSRPVRLVITTANWSVARLLMQKFYGVRRSGADACLRVIQLSGNVRIGISQSVIFPAGDKGAESSVH